MFYFSTVGNCRTVMISNVSPSSMSFEDTYNTLKYADRAKVRSSFRVCDHLTQKQMIILLSFSENKNQPEEESCVGQFPRRSVCQDRGGAEKRSERSEAQE